MVKEQPPYQKTYHPTRGEMTWNEELSDYVDAEGKPLHQIPPAAEQASPPATDEDNKAGARRALPKKKED